MTCAEFQKVLPYIIDGGGSEEERKHLETCHVCSDLVADLRAATPTDAAKKIVPDTVAEQHLLDDLRRRSAQALRNWVGREERALAQLRSRPVLAAPLAALATRADEIHRARSAVRRDITRLIDVQAERVGHLSARLATLGPAATLARGYAVVQTIPTEGPSAVLRSIDDAPAGTRATRNSSELITTAPSISPKRTRGCALPRGHGGMCTVPMR